MKKIFTILSFLLLSAGLYAQTTLESAFKHADTLGIERPVRVLHKDQAVIEQVRRQPLREQPHVILPLAIPRKDSLYYVVPTPSKQ